MALATKDDQATQVVYTGIAGGPLDGWTMTLQKTTDGTIQVSISYSAAFTQAHGMVTWPELESQFDSTYLAT
jgi:hypothetical protein